MSATSATSEGCSVVSISENQHVKTFIKAYARELGFDLVGVTTAEPFTSHKPALQRLKGGLMAGLPWYTQARVERGSDPQQLLPGARSIIALGMSYLASENNGAEGAAGEGPRRLGPEQDRQSPDDVGLAAGVG